MDVKKVIAERDSEYRNKYQVTFVRNNNDGCTRYRLDMPGKALSMNTDRYNIAFKSAFTPDDIYFSDLFMMLQVPEWRADDIEGWKMARAANLKLSMDYNDDIFNIPPNNPAALRYEATKAFEDMMRQVDGMTVTTTWLRDIIKKFNSNIAVIPNHFDMGIYRNLMVTTDEARVRWEANGKRTVVGYIGSANHTEDQVVFFDAISEIMRERDDVELAVFGIYSQKLLEEFGARVRSQKFMTLNSYFMAANNLGVDILCAPNLDISFNKCKSNIKWLEGTFVGSTIISSPLPAFVDLGEDVCSIVPWDKDYTVEVAGWRQAIEALLDDPDKRFDMHRRSLEWMASEWDIGVGWQSWDDYMTRILEGRSVAGLDYTPRRNNEIQGKDWLRADGPGIPDGGDGVGTGPEPSTDSGCVGEEVAGGGN